MEKLVITVAPNGGLITKTNTPYVPITTEEIAEEVSRSCEAGASIVHLHVREEDGTPTGDMKVFEEAVNKIRDRCDILIGLTTASKLNAPEEERLSVCELSPQLASLNMGSLNFGEVAFINSPNYLRNAAKKMQDKKVKPELEVFDLGMMENAKKLIAEGLISGPYHFQLILGAPGGSPATPKALLGMIDNLPENSTWGVIALQNQLLLHTMAIGLGGHIRVGMEDEIYIRPGELAKSNSDFIKRLVMIANEMGRSVATPAEAEVIFTLPSRRHSSIS
ncbi:3-keto-5-aminohexanoate cleavage protein [Psychrobacillus soli]|uniref:3-keto-5-aminohexanoate cleavage protein n=1 Tax=Psychrobacillus soli TaxID=1543965 RepID=A0A544SWR9_9BACI|nr:3-keto-5-aminohexanoate cleavage protein [Psychrobacillus soli]TQR09659.1 3-keto-5-aminohexanoate cleavage protein [Psychrobacillus soli]